MSFHDVYRNFTGSKWKMSIRSSDEWVITLSFEFSFSHECLDRIFDLNIIKLSQNIAIRAREFVTFVKFRILWKILSKWFILKHFLRSNTFEYQWVRNGFVEQCFTSFLNFIFDLLWDFMWSLTSCFVRRTWWLYTFSASRFFRRLSPRLWIISIWFFIKRSFLFDEMVIDSLCQFFTHLLSDSLFLIRCSSSIPRNEVIAILNMAIRTKLIDLD